MLAQLVEEGGIDLAGSEARIISVADWFGPVRGAVGGRD
jgi:hypothetical protein